MVLQVEICLVECHKKRSCFMRAAVCSSPHIPEALTHLFSWFLSASQGQSQPLQVLCCHTHPQGDFAARVLTALQPLERFRSFPTLPLWECDKFCWEEIFKGICLMSQEICSNQPDLDCGWPLVISAVWAAPGYSSLLLHGQDPALLTLLLLQKSAWENEL